MLQRLALRLPPAARRRATPKRVRLLVQFAMFGTVGLAGLAVDTATVYALRAPLGLYGAGLFAYLTGATTTWALNRAWTFRDHGGGGGGGLIGQWARFLGANLGGFALNRGTYVALVAFVPLASRVPAVATSAGAVAGMFVNFAASRSYVFRADKDVAPPDGKT